MKYFREELDYGYAIVYSQISDNLTQRALNGELTAMIFWLKCRARWSERGLIQQEGADASGNASGDATVVILPDNGRDPQPQS
jgi:hypothetical protein